MPGCLADISRKISYGPADDRLRDLDSPALSRSVTYTRTAGFFSSGALAGRLPGPSITPAGGG